MDDHADYAALDRIRPRIELNKEEREGTKNMGPQWFIDRKAEFQRCPCPACGATDICDEYDGASGTHYVRCADCMTLYMAPRPTREHYAQIARESRNTYWEKMLETSRDARTELIYRPRLAEMRRLIAEFDPAFKFEGARYLEVGAGTGIFAQIVRDDAGCDVTVVEPWIAGYEMCEKRGLRTIKKMIEDVEPGEIEADIAAAFECIEHLNDPSVFVRKISSALRPGGMLCLTCPNGAGLDVVELRERSTTISWWHLNLFTPSSIRKFLRANGFEVLAQSTPGILDVDLIKEAARAGSISPHKMSFYDRIIHDADLARDFQQFLRDHALSSHMMTIARKLS